MNQTLINSGNAGKTSINLNSDSAVENLVGTKVLEHYNVITKLQTQSGEAATRVSQHFNPKTSSNPLPALTLLWSDLLEYSG